MRFDPGESCACAALFSKYSVNSRPAPSTSAPYFHRGGTGGGGGGWFDEASALSMREAIPPLGICNRTPSLGAKREHPCPTGPLGIADHHAGQDAGSCTRVHVGMITPDAAHVDQRIPYFRRPLPQRATRPFPPGRKVARPSAVS